MWHTGAGLDTAPGTPREPAAHDQEVAMTEDTTTPPAFRRHVVVGFDGREHSRRALHWAAD